MSGRTDQDGKDPALLPFLPPLVKSIPASLRHREFDPNDRSTWGDQGIVLDEEDERILDKVWAEVAHHPWMAADPHAPHASGASTNGRRGRRQAAVDEANVAEDGDVPTALGAAPEAEQ